MEMEMLLEELLDMASGTLQPYKDLVAKLAGAVTILYFFAGIVVCRDISRNGSTRGFRAVPFIGATAIGILFLQYGVIIERPTIILVSFVAVFLNVLYTVFFYLKSEDRKNEVLKPTACAVALVAVVLGYVRSDTTDNILDNVKFRMFGFILNTLMLFLMGMPLLDVKEIIRRKDASIISFPMTFMGAIVTFFWLLDGVILRDNFLIAPNAIGFILCSFQLILIVIYRPQLIYLGLLLFPIFSQGYLFAGIFAQNEAPEDLVQFRCATAIGILSLQYPVTLEDRTMILKSLVAVFLNVYSKRFFYVQSEDRKNEVLKPTAYAVALVAVLLGYIF